MKKPEPTRRQKERFLKATQFRYRMELVIDFDHPVTIQQGRETARKLLDALSPSVGAVETPDGYGEASIKCSELRRILKLVIE